MSAESSKKKRIGSRRRQANQNKEPDEFHIADSTSGAQHRSAAEENAESLSPDNTTSELQDPASPDLSGSRRKLGSSRRNKRRQHAKDSTESHHKPKEEAEEKIGGNETLNTTRTSVAAQLEGREELGDDRESDTVSAADDGSLHLADAPDYTSEIYNFARMRRAEVDLESLNPEGENLKVDYDDNITDYEVVSHSHHLLETILEEIDKSEREDVNDKADFDDISTLSSLGEVSNVYSGMAQESEDTDLLKQDGNSLISYLMSEPHVESVDLRFSITPEITTEGGSPLEQTGADYGVEQEMFPLAEEEISTNEEQQHRHSFSVVRGALCSEDGKDNKQEMQKTDFCESVTHYATDKSELIYGNPVEKAEASETHQSESTVEITDDTATKEENSNPDHKVLEEEIEAEVQESKSSSQTFEPAVNPPADSQAQDNHVTIEEQTHADVSSISNRRKMGSSRRHKGQKQVQDSEHEHEVEIFQSNKGDGATEPVQMLRAIEASQGELGQGSELDVVMPVTHDSSVDSVVTSGYSHEVQRIFSHEDRGDHSSDETVNKADNHEVKQQMQEIPQVNHDATETNVNHSEVSDKYQSELTDDLAGEQDDSNNEKQQKEHLTKENTFEAFDHRHEDDRADDTKAAQVSDTERLDTTTSQIFQIKSTGEGEIKASVEHTSEVEEELLSVEESDSYLQSLQSEIHPPIDDTDFKSTGNTDSVDESYNTPTEEDFVNVRDNEEPDSTKMSLMIDTAVQEESVGTILEEVEEIDTTLTEEVPYQLKGNSVVGISELRSLYQDSTVDQQLSDQSNLMEMPDDLSNVKSVTEKETKEGNENIGLSDLDGDGQVNYVVSELHEESEDMTFSVVPDITTERSSPVEQTEPEYNIKQTTLSSPREELLTIEGQKEFYNLSGAEGECHSEDNVNHINEQEVNPTQLQDDVTENSELISGQQVDKAKDTYESELIVNISDDSNPHDEALNEHEKEEIFSADQETGQLLLTIDTMSQVDLSLGGEFDITMPETPDSSFHTANMSDFSCEVQSKPSINYQEAEMESSFLNKEIFQDYEESETSFYVEASDVSLDPGLEEMNKSVHLQNEEVTGVHYLEDAVNKMHEEEVEPEQMQEQSQIDHSSENVINDATENLQTDQSEESSTYQSVLIVQSPDDAAPEQEDPNFEDNQDDHLKNEDAFTALQLLNNDYYDTREPQISDSERADGAQGRECKSEDKAEDYFSSMVEQKGHQEKEGLSSEMEDRAKNMHHAEINPPLVSQPQDDSVEREVQTHTGFTGSRRKMGSSRRHKGRKQVEDSAAEHEENILQSSKDDKAFDPIQMLLEIDTRQEEFGHGSEHGVIMTATHGSGVDSAIMSDYLSDVEKSTTTNYQETEVESLIPESENLQQDHEERETGSEVEASDVPLQQEMDKSNNLLSEEVKGDHHLEDTDSKVFGSEVEPEKMQEEHQTFPTSQNVDVAAEHEDLKAEDKQNNKYEALNQTYEVDQAEDTKTPQISDTERLDTTIGQVNEIKTTGGDDMKHSGEFKSHQKKEGLFSQMEESHSSFQTFQSDIYHPVDAQPERNDTDFKSIGSRRKLGSSRRNKGRHRSPSRPTEGMTGKTEDEESLETAKISLATESEAHEKSMETTLEEINKADTTQTEEVYDQESADVGVSALSPLSLHSGVTMDQQLSRRSDSMEMPDETEKENKEREETPEATRHDGNVQGVYDVSESHERSEYKSYITQEITTGNSSREQRNEIVCCVEQPSISPSNEVLFANEEERERVNSSEVRVVLLSQDVENDNQRREEADQTCDNSAQESEPSLQTVQSDINAPNETHQPLDQSNSGVQDPQTHAGFNHTGNRKKFGSSRRNKGRHVVKETKPEPDEESENKTGDGEANEAIKMTLATETMGQEELQSNIKPAGKIRNARSTSNDEEMEEKIPEEIVLSQDDMENRIIETTDVNLSSGKDDLIKSTDAEENDIMNDISGPTVYDLTKSSEVLGWKEAAGVQSLSHQGEIEQEEAIQVKNTEPLSCETDKGMNVQKANDAIETVGDISIKEHHTEEERLVDVDVPEQVGEKLEEGCETSVLEENTRTEMFSATNKKTDSSALLSAGLEENIGAERAVDGGKSRENSAQKRRKMGSTRRTLLKNLEKGTQNEDGAKESDLSKESNQVTSSQDEKAKVQLVPSYKEQQEMNETGSVEPSQLDDLTSPEMPPTSLVGETSNSSVNLLPSSKSTNTDITAESVVSIGEATQSRQNDEERLESGNATKGQALKSTEAPLVTVVDLGIEKSSLEGRAGEENEGDESGAQEPNFMDQADNNANPEMKDPGPDLNPPHRRRKMGSTRRSFGPQAKGEDLHQKEEDNEATEAVTHVKDGKTVSFKEFNEEEILINVEEPSIDSERKVKVLETVEYSQTGESQSEPSYGHRAETEQLTADHLPVTPSTSPQQQQNTMSEVASPGRRRKLGSHRRSRGPQSNENSTKEGDGRTDTASRSDDKTTEGPSLGLDKISEIEESDMKASSNISTSETGEHVSGKTQAAVNPNPEAGIKLVPGNLNLSLADQSSSTFNVVLVGDSSVGKTSYMKRAHSGKFSLEVPASIGLDTCKWTVLVDGKAVVLHLWDTAGQERFRSLTKQILHKAQAFLLMYDITSPQSFTAVSYWANCIKEGAAENVTILLLGNKSDHTGRQVQTEDGEALAKANGFEFMECSAATGENVIQSLEAVARRLNERVDRREEVSVLQKEPQRKKTSGCC